MANTIIHKRSNVADSTPTASQLTLGELALNTADGKVYMKKGNGEVIDISYQQDRVRGEFSAGTGVFYNDITGVIAIGQPVNQTSNVQFASINVANGLNIGGETSFGGDIAISGSAVMTGTLDVGGDTVINGNLTVNGSTTTLNSTVLTVDDINVVLGSTASPSNATANGGGITLKGTTDKTIIWDSINNNWTSSENWNLANTKIYKINNIPVLSINELFGGGQTTVSIAPAATAINIGSATGLTTINTDVKIDGDLEVTGITSSTGTTSIGSDLIVEGNLTVNGSTTTLNSTVLTVDDINIVLGSTNTPTNSTANGGGITLKGTTDKTIIWDNTNANWTSSEHWNLANTKVYKINNLEVLSSNQLFNDGQTTVTLAPSATALTVGSANGILTLRNPTVVGVSSVQNVYNTVATNVNAFGAGTNVVLSATTGTTRIRNNLIVDGAITFNSTGQVSGNMVLEGDLKVNGCDITTDCLSFNLINTTATTVNAFGTASTINMGANTGTLTLRNPTLVGTQTTQNVYDTVATTVNAFGTASTINMGADSGTITIGNPTLVGTQTTQNVYDTVATAVNAFGAATAINLGADSGTIAIGNPTLVGTQTTQNVYNTVATNVNAFGAGTNVVLSATTGTTRIRNNLIVDGTIAFESTGNILGDMTVQGDLKVNGCDITTDCTTFNLINTTAATVNFAGAAAEINMGANTGTLTLRNPTLVGTQTTQNVYNTVATTVNAFGAATAVNIGAGTGITTVNNNLVVQGDLTVNGTTTTVNSTVVTVDDINVVLGDTASPTDTTANTGGIILKGSTDKTITWDTANTNWTSSEHWNLVSGKTYKIDNVEVLSSNSLFNGGQTTVTIAPSGTDIEISATTGTTRIRNNLIVDGTIAFESTGNILGDMTIQGDLKVNGCDIITDCTTFNLINTTATTVNFAGAATAIEIGAATGTTRVKNDLEVNGTLRVSTITNDDHEANLSITADNYVIIDSNTNGQIEIGRNSGVGRVILGSTVTGVTIGDTGGDVDIKGNTLDIDVVTTTISGDTVINGNLTVNGATTTVNSTVLTVDDINIVLGDTASPTDATANGGGITLKGTTDKTITYDLINAWSSSEHWNLVSGKTYKIDNVEVLSQNSLFQFHTLGVTIAPNCTDIVMAGTTGTTRIRNNLIVDGTITFNSTGQVSGNMVLDGDLKVNGCDITTDCTTFNLINTTATTVNFAGAATAIEIGSATGTTNINHDLDVDGNTLLNGTLGVDGTLSVTGNTTLTSDLAVNGGDITTTATAFNLLNTNATSVNAFGAGTNVVLSATTGTTTIRNNLVVDGTITFNSTGQVSGNMILDGDLKVNGCDITTDCTTFNLINTTATTVNFAGAATAIEIGAATGTTNINNSLDVDGNTTLNGTLGVDGNSSIGGTLGVTGLSTLATARVSSLTSGRITFAGASGQLIDSANLTWDGFQVVVNGNVEARYFNAVNGVNLNYATTNAVAYVDGTGALVTNASLGWNGTTLAVTGNETISGTLAVTGNTTLTGDLAVNGGDITTTASSFNLLNSSATAINFAGAATSLTMSATTGTTTIRNNLVVEGTVSFASTGSLTDNLTLSGDLKVNGCDITTDCTTFNLINTTATTVNFAGAGTAVNIGASSGNTTVNNNLIVSGNLTVSGTTTTVNTETINLADNIITLNSNASGAPSENAGIEVGRGSSANVSLRWNEGSDKWEATRDGSTFVVLPINTSELAEDPSATVTSGTMYYTNARARNAISVTDAGGDGSLSYDNSTGVITYTGPSASEVRAHLSVTDAGGDGSLSYNSSTGVITYTGPSATEVRAHLSVTDAGGDGSLSYNSSTGVITYTGPSATEVRAHLSGGTGVTYNSSTGVISIGQEVSTTSNVTFNNITMSGDVNWTTTGRGITWGMNTDGASIRFYNAGDGDTASRLEFQTVDNTNEYFSWTHNSGGSTFESMRLVPNGSGNAALTVYGNATINGTTTGTFSGNLTGNVTGTVSSLSNQSTTNLAEGTNLYYTDARARAALSFTAGSGAYNSSTGVITIPTNTNQLTNGAGYLTSAVSSVATGNGLTGGTITSTGTISMSGSYTGSFSATGEITAYSSDKRLKTDLKPIDNALEKVLSLHGVTYSFNELAESFGFDKNVRQAGLLAQEVNEVMPEVIARAPFDVKVSEGKETSKSGEDYMTIKYEKLVALLVEAIKELNDKVETLEAQLSSSKSV